MENKRYQVFVSSTFTDLPQERQAVFQALLRTKCIPAGMEFFGAVDDIIFEFIKKVIDTCDYYLVIVGGRYGAPTADGISYTEKEYDYAVNVRKLKVIGLLHRKPEDIPMGKSELDPKARRRLESFRKKVGESRLVAHWENASELKAEAALAMVTALDMFPAVGWVRADTLAHVDALNELHELRREVDRLRAAVAEPAPEFADMAKLDDEILVHFYSHGDFDKVWNSVVTVAWRDLLGATLPHLLTPQTEDLIARTVGRWLQRRTEDHGDSPRMAEDSFVTLKVQLMGLRAISFVNETTSNPLMWELTPAGRRLMFETRIVRTAAEPQLPSSSESDRTTG